MLIKPVTVLCGGPGPELPGYDNIYAYDNRENNVSPAFAYQHLMDGTKEDVIAYFHDDVTVHDEAWLARVEECFLDRSTVAVGFGGAPQLGSKDLYRKRYVISNMARFGYMSNQTDWKTHGLLETGTRRVAVLDAFFMAVRRDFLKAVGGWPVDHLTHHCLDLWLGCIAARWGKDIVMTGVSCTHHGGGTSTKEKYAKAKWLQGGSLHSDHQEPHVWLYEEFSDVLPIIVGM